MQPAHSTPKDNKQTQNEAFVEINGQDIEMSERHERVTHSPNRRWLPGGPFSLMLPGPVLLRNGVVEP